MSDNREEEFYEWMRMLNEDVIQREFGYEDGEFTAYPSMWRYAFNKGMTPRQVFIDALAAVPARPQRQSRGDEG